MRVETVQVNQRRVTLNNQQIMHHKYYTKEMIEFEILKKFEKSCTEDLKKKLE